MPHEYQALRYALRMNIFIDEAGLFVPSPNPSSFNVVGAYVASERSRKGIDALLAGLRRAAGVGVRDEVKLKHLDHNPELLRKFLLQLQHLDGVYYATLSDAHLDSAKVIAHHQREFVTSMRQDVAKMRCEGTKEMVSTLAEQLAGLSPQLYAQLYHQSGLIELVSHSAILYFVQRYPATLGAFRWRIDQKNTSKTVYEDAFSKIVPPLLQTRTMKKPLIMIEGFDYSHMDQFLTPVPAHLKAQGIRDVALWDITKVFHSDLEDADSKTFAGLQIVDVLTSCMRRCMRGEFGTENERVAAYLGRLMVQPPKGESIVRFTTFAPEQYLPSSVARLVTIMAMNCRQMVIR